jgi:transposase
VDHLYHPLHYPAILLFIFYHYTKTSRQEHYSEIKAVIYKLKDLGFSAFKISNETKVPKSTITQILQDYKKGLSSEQSVQKKASWPPKLNKCAEQALLQKPTRYLHFLGYTK